jgi:hypothetical protein
MIIDFALLFEHSTGQPCILYGTMFAATVAKELAGICKFHFLGLR